MTTTRSQGRPPPDSSSKSSHKNNHSPPPLPDQQQQQQQQQQQAQPLPQRKGNLHSLLKAFDAQNNNPNSTIPTYKNNNNNNYDNASLKSNASNQEENETASNISISQFETIGNIGRERSSTLGSLRERGLTFGSEFDLGLGLTNDTVAHDAVFDLSVVNGGSGSGSAAANQSGMNASNNNHYNYQQQRVHTNNNNNNTMGNVAVGGQQHQLTASIPIPTISNTTTNVSTTPQDMTLQEQSQEMFQETSSQTSGHGFLSKMFNSNHSSEGGGGGGGQPTGYEIKHYGKRLRSGSLSGRLRSMSDLEDKGIIDSNQKGILKDLIISGDSELMTAVEQYEKGDTKALESIIKNRTRAGSDIDILGDLDLDFLSMNEDMGAATGAGGDSTLTSGGGVGPGGRRNSRNFPIAIRTRRRSMSENSNGLRGSPPTTVHGDRNYDDIGDLDFNADFSSGGGTGVKTRSNSIMDLARNRANSLAFGSLLDDSNTDELDSVGKWMDRAPAIQERKMPLKKRVSSQVVGANGGLYIINNNGTTTRAKGSRKNTKKDGKLTVAEIKRREREHKKAIKEREKLERKAQKQREKQEKKERDAKERKAGRKRKNEASPKRKKAEIEEDVENDEPKVIVSGTGRPRSLSDPNLSIKLDANGLMQIDHPPDWVGAYSPESRKIRIERFLAKRNHRVWVKKVKYDVRKNFADSRLRVKGRFVKKEDELLMRDLMSLT